MIKANDAVIPKWSIALVGKMHAHKISKTELANYMGYRREYITRLFNGNENASEKKVEEITSAINEIIAERS